MLRSLRADPTWTITPWLRGPHPLEGHERPVHVAEVAHLGNPGELLRADFPEGREHRCEGHVHPHVDGAEGTPRSAAPPVCSWAKSATSAGMAGAWPPRCSTSLEGAAPSPAWPRATSPTRSPRAPNRTAMALPIPALAPVTTIVLGFGVLVFVAIALAPSLRRPGTARPGLPEGPAHGRAGRDWAPRRSAAWLGRPVEKEAVEAVMVVEVLDMPQVGHGDGDRVHAGWARNGRRHQGCAIWPGRRLAATRYSRRTG